MLFDELGLFAHRDERTDVEIHDVHVALVRVNGAVVLLVLEYVDGLKRGPDLWYIDVQVVKQLDERFCKQRLLRLNHVVLLVRVRHQVHVEAELHAQSHHVAEALVRVSDHNLKKLNPVLLFEE